MSRRYRIGAVGAGGMGIGHVRALAASGRWELAYVCDLSDERLKLAGEAAPRAELVKDYQRLLADESLDAVSLNTLSNVRPGLIRQAVAAGKHVICEKPLAPTAAEASQLVEELRGTDRLITTNLFNRNAPYLHEAMRFIAEGEIGELAVIRVNHCTAGLPVAERQGYSHRGVEGHVLHDCGMHYVDVMRWFAGSEYRDFSARAVRFWADDYESYFMVHGSFENEIAFELHNSFCYTTLAKDRRNNSGQEFIGTHGVVTLKHDFQTVTVQMNGRTRTVRKTMPYGGKKLDIYYAAFARALDTGDLGALPRLTDAVTASEVAQRMVDAALAGPVPTFGQQADLTEAAGGTSS